MHNTHHIVNNVMALHLYRGTKKMIYAVDALLSHLYQNSSKLFKAAFRETPTPPLPCVTGHRTKLWENGNSTTMYMTLFIDRRDEIGGFESARLWSTTFEAVYQAIVAMLRQKAPIKVQRVARWGWTAPQCSTYLWGALFTLTTVGAGERRAGKCFGFVYTSGSSVKEREREKKRWIRQRDASHKQNQ